MFIKLSDPDRFSIALTEAKIMTVDPTVKTIHRYYDPVNNNYELVMSVAPELVVLLLLLDYKMVEITMTGFCCSETEVENLLALERIVKEASGENPFMVTQEGHFLAFIGKVIEPLADYPQFATIYK